MVKWLSGIKEAFKSSFSKTSTLLTTGIGNILHSRKLDEETLQELEEMLISSDLGIAMCRKFIDKLRGSRFDQKVASNEAIAMLHSLVVESLAAAKAAPFPISQSITKPFCILICGVNGSGKTTTIAKLAYELRQYKVAMAGCDTFRAAASQQLESWGNKINCPVFLGDQGADPASVAYTAMEKARSLGLDVLLVDTAGRLHNQANLMAELSKCRRVLQKLDPSAPHRTILVLDGTTGQNAYSQVALFKEAAAVTDLIITKLDGTAKGGVVVGIAEQYKIPIYALGIGEQLDDLIPFSPQDLADAVIGSAN